MTDETTTSLRRCSGSARFGIEAHEAPVEEFPRQRSQRNGLGRMCRAHWNAYTAGLARDAKTRQATAGRDPATPAAEEQDAAPEAGQPKGEPESAGKPARRATVHEADLQDAAAG